MAVVCIIPARGGSKGVPGKNLRRVGARRLVERAIDSASAVSLIDVVCVTTDDDRIAEVSVAAGGRVVRRPTALATDTASSESAIIHALDELAASGDDPTVVVFVQCTSPFIDPGDLESGIEMVTKNGFDSVFSAVRSHDFLWQPHGDSLRGVNHREDVRERRQDRPLEYRETGAFYAMGVAGFRESGHRFFGRIGACEVDPATSIDIDTIIDLANARSIADALSMSRLERLDPTRVGALVMDFDGVHTDNRVFIDQAGVESVVANRSDGLGLAALRRAGLPMLILSTERNPVVQARAEKLGVECKSGQGDKLAALKEWAMSNSISASQIAYVGNDRNDLECLEWVGWPIVVADAHPSVASIGALVTSQPGGQGAVREITDRLLEHAGTSPWDEVD